MSRVSVYSMCVSTVWVIKKFPFRLRGTVFQRYYALRFRTVSVFIISVLLILTRSTCERTGRCETDNGRCGTDDGVYSRGSRPHVPTSGKGQFLGCAESAVLT